jgi:hypothetical protein
MALQHNPSIVTSGLIACFDPANPRTYSGSGTTIYDASGNGYTGTLVNGVTYTTSNGGLFVLDGTDDYIDIPINLSTTNYTIMGVSRYIGATGRNRTFSAKNNNWLMGHWSGTTENHYAEGWVTAVGAGPGDNNWRIYAASGNISGDSYNFYVNGVLNTGPSTGGSAGPNGFAIGSYAGSSEFSNAQIGFMLVYNTVLTAAQIAQNFNAYRGRYGI